MKKLAIAVALLSVALSVSAAPHSGTDHRGLGRCTYTPNADSTFTVPETGSTLALASIGFAALGFASMALKRKD